MHEDIACYKSLHTAWYDLKNTHPDEEQLQFYQQYINKDTDRILEPMCGSGRYLIPLARLGYTIDGFDASSHMLERCSAACHEYGIQPRPRLWHDKIQEFQAPDTYQCIFISDGAFGLITDRQEAFLSLQHLYRHLAPGGILICGAEKPALAHEAKRTPKHTWKGNMCMYADGSYMLLHKMYLPLNDQVLPMVLWYSYIADNACQQQEVSYLGIRTYEPDEMRALLTQAGFHDIQVRKAYDALKEPDSEDVRIIYVCRKDASV